MKFEVFIVANVKAAIFWDVTLCSLVKCMDISKILLAPSTQRTMAHRLGSSETPVHVYQTTHCHITQDSNLEYLFLWVFLMYS